MKRRLTKKSLLELRYRLEEVWGPDTAHEEYGGINNQSPLAERSSVGQCYVTTLIAYDYLEDYKPKIVHGSVVMGGSKEIDNNHFWLEINNKIIDLTADQFPELGLPPVVFGSYSEFPQYKPQKYDTGIPRYRKLKKRLEKAFPV